MRKYKIIPIILFMNFVLLTGCGIGVVENKESAVYENIVQNHGVVAERDDYYYIGLDATGFFSIDKENYELSPVCRDAVCSHTLPTCTFKSNVNCIRNYKGKIYVTCRDYDSARNIIYELNEDTYELTPYYKIGKDEIITYFDFYDDKLVMCIVSDDYNKRGLYLEDIKTSERKTILERGDSLFNIAYDEDYFYASTTEMEIYRIDAETFEKTRVGDGLGKKLVLHEDILYFLRSDENWNTSLYSINTDGTSERLIEEDVSAFRIYDNKIYYTKNDEGSAYKTTLYVSDLKGEAEEIILEEVECYDDLYLLPEVDKLLLFNGESGELYKEYAVVNFDGSDSISNIMPEFNEW